MKNLSLLFLMLTLTAVYKPTTNKPFFQIFENGKAGYIDGNGQIVIKPIFRTADKFSEGLASVRINGTYGYIDETGDLVIKPQFDFATAFKEGLAIVYKNGQPFFINKQGEKPFEINFPHIEQFENGRAKIQTGTNKFGFIDKSGKLIIDTIFAEINLFVEGMAVVEGINHHPYADKKEGIKKNYEAGVIDTLGQFVITYGKYEAISDFKNGYFKAEIPAEPWDTIDGYTTKTAFIDKRGILILARDHKKGCWIDGNINCGLAKMNLYKYWLPEETGVSYTTSKSYEGFINLNGEIVINDTAYKSVTDFSDNRAFVKDDGWYYSLINTKGEIIARNAFDNIADDCFKEGVAFVSVDGEWGLIDTNANFIVKPQFSKIDERGLIDDYFFFQEPDPSAKNDYDNLSGVARKDGTILIKPMMQEFDRAGFKNGLLKCVVNSKLTYINKNGKIIWQSKSNGAEQVFDWNIDYMNRGYFYAYSKPNKNDIGGYGGSGNVPRKISTKENFPSESLSVVVRPEMTKMYKGGNGITVFIANTSKKEIGFNAQDSRLYMKVQALNSYGEWKDIEYLPSSWCGNSYHTLTLETNHYWEFLTPAYDGDFKTKLRIELKYIDPTDKSKNHWDRKDLTIYSNEYDGSINPGQFWRKLEYFPSGIMDPYNN